MDSYLGTIIEESLENKSVLKEIEIISTRTSIVTEKHKTPWIKHWTLHSVKILENKAEEIAKKLSKSLDSKHNWYADYKNNKFHYIIFRNKIFKIERTSKEQYNQAKEYGLSLGIPYYQVDFHPDISEWKQ